MEAVKTAVESVVVRMVGSRDPVLTSTALMCLQKGYDRKNAAKLLGNIVAEGDVGGMVDELVRLREEFNGVLPPLRKRKSILDNEIKESKKPKFSTNGNNDINDINNNDKLPSSFGQLTADKIRETMEKAQREIRERKEQMNLQTQSIKSEYKPPTTTPKQLNNTEVEMMRKANELQARIQAKLASAGISAAINATPAVPAAGPTPLILDDFGRTIDGKTGQLVKIEQYTPTLKANIRAKKREHFKAVQEKPVVENNETEYFDARLKPNMQVRNRKTFKFYEQGKFEKIGQKIRTKVLLEKLQGEIAVAAKKTGIATAAKLAIIQPRKETMDEVPNVEWWDTVILQNDDFYPDETSAALFEGITHLVEHPIQIKSPGEDTKQGVLKVMLTKEERRKLRRQARNEAQKEIQEKIKLGLINPPEPKVKLSNLMRVLGSDAVSNPTKVESHVRSQMAKRQKAHIDANQERKLTKAQRREKRMKKLREDTSNGVVVSVYRVRDLTHPSDKFKVEMNANQLFMTGIIILHKDCNVIVVEGGPKQSMKFNRLVTQRIKWDKKDKGKNDDDDDDDADDEEEEKKENGCQLVWEGSVKQRSFKEMRFKTCPTEAYAREQLKKHGTEHYWDLAFSSTILENTANQ